MKEVGYKVEDGIAWLTMNNPPLNALSHALRKAVLTALDRAARRRQGACHRARRR